MCPFLCETLFPSIDKSGIIVVYFFELILYAFTVAKKMELVASAWEIHSKL